MPERFDEQTKQNLLEGFDNVKEAVDLIVEERNVDPVLALLVLIQQEASATRAEVQRITTQAAQQQGQQEGPAQGPRQRKDL